MLLYTLFYYVPVYFVITDPTPPLAHLNTLKISSNVPLIATVAL